MFKLFDKKPSREEIRNVKAVVELLTLVNDGTIQKRLELANELEEKVSTIVNKQMMTIRHEFEEWWMLNKEEDYRFSDEVTKYKAKSMAVTAWFACAKEITKQMENKK